MLRRFSLCLASLSLALPTQAFAQDQDEARPDEGNSWKYFYFHKEGVSEEVAKADISECYSFSRNLTVPKGGSNPTYSSVPYGGSTGLNYATAALVGGVAGLAGAVITGFMDAGDRRAMERTNLRKCFGFKGYSRYELTKEDYKILNDGEPEEVRVRLLEKATGAAPSEERLVG